MIQIEIPMHKKVVREEIGGETYAYISLGKYVVSSSKVCRGRPTFKYTRIEVAGVLNRLAAGHTIEELVAGYRGRVSEAAIKKRQR